MPQSLKHGDCPYSHSKVRKQGNWSGPHFIDEESEGLRSVRLRATQRVSGGVQIPTQAQSLNPDSMLLTTPGS